MIIQKDLQNAERKEVFNNFLPRINSVIKTRDTTKYCWSQGSQIIHQLHIVLQITRCTLTSLDVLGTIILLRTRGYYDLSSFVFDKISCTCVSIEYETVKQLNNEVSTSNLYQQMKYKIIVTYPLVETNSSAIVYRQNLVGSFIDVSQGKIRYVTVKRNMSISARY